MEAVLQTVSNISSPALRSFESNPFRILRLAVNATTSEAAIQAERVLTLMRAGLAPEESDPLPWLPPASTYEVQQAAQTVEEPLARLTEQLLWFDTGRDPEAAQLRALLRELTDEELQKHFKEEVGLPKADECAPDDETAVPRIAQAVNQANLRLLLAASLVNGVAIQKTDAPFEPIKIGRKEWQTLHGLTVLPEAHNVIAGTQAGADAALEASRYWEYGLRRWILILLHPWFKHYLRQCIDDLGDDFISADDAETIEESIRTRLADLSTKEVRFLLLEGRYTLASGMISALGKSGLEKRIIGPALRPIHHLFQSEISELNSLLDDSGAGDVQHIDAYLKRLAAIKQRWRKLDEANLVGLSYILDDALEQAYLRLRKLEKPDAQSDALLLKVSQLAGAASLRERVSFYRNELEEAKKHLCHYCKTGAPDYEKSVVLKGKKETDRVHNYNSTTIYYGLRYAIILRCERCARFHDFIYKFGWLNAMFLIPTILIVSLPILISLLFIVCFVGIFVVSYLPAAFTFIATCISLLLARIVTPEGHTRYGQYRDTEAMHSLSAEGYSIEVDWRSTAISAIQDQ